MSFKLDPGHISDAHTFVVEEWQLYLGEEDLVLAEEAWVYEKEGPSKNGGATANIGFLDAVAVPGLKVGALRQMKSSVGLLISKLTWGDYHGQGACQVMLSMIFRSENNFRLERTTVKCTVTPSDDSSQTPPSSTTTFRQPRILRYAPSAGPANGKPSTLNENSTTEIVNNYTLAPEVALLGVSVKVGSVSHQKTYHPIEGMLFYGDSNFDDEVIQWSMLNKSNSSSHCIYDLEAEFLVAHGGRDFNVEFRIAPRLNFAGRVFSMGSKTATKKLRFTVEAGAARFT